jgi:hypothetical protein
MEDSSSLRIVNLRSLVEQGRYEIDVEAVAAAIVRRMLAARAAHEPSANGAGEPRRSDPVLEAG